MSIIRLLAWQQAAPRRSVTLSHRPDCAEELGEFFASAAEDGDAYVYGQHFAPDIEAAAAGAIEDLRPIRGVTDDLDQQEVQP